MNKEERRLYMIDYRRKNKAHINEYNKRYKELNSEFYNNYYRDYYSQNKEKIRVNQRVFHSKNKDYYKKYKEIDYPNSKNAKSRYIKERKKYDAGFKVACNLRSRLSFFVRGKPNNTLHYVGCTVEQLKNHLQNQFKEGMSWENYGEWHIDHIYPLSKVDLTLEENIHKVMHYSNLQPLWAEENIKKSNKIEKTFDFE